MTYRAGSTPQNSAEHITETEAHEALKEELVAGGSPIWESDPKAWRDRLNDLQVENGQPPFIGDPNQDVRSTRLIHVYLIHEGLLIGGSYSSGEKMVVAPVPKLESEVYAPFARLARSYDAVMRTSARHGNCSVFRVREWALARANMSEDLLLDLVSSILHTSRYWVGFVSVKTRFINEPSCLYGNVSEEAFESLQEMRREGRSPVECAVAMAHDSRPVGSDIDKYLLVRDGRLPDDPLFRV